MSVKHKVPVPDHVYSRYRLIAGSMTRKKRVFEAALHRALDELGAPRLERGPAPPPVEYCVGLWQCGEYRGYLGPFVALLDAERVLRLWQRTKGYTAEILKGAAGKRLTNCEGGAVP